MLVNVDATNTHPSLSAFAVIGRIIGSVCLNLTTKPNIMRIALGDHHSKTIKLIVWDLSPRIDMIGLVDEQWDAVHTSDWFNLRSLLSPLTPRSQGLRPTNISILSRASLCWGRNVEESPEALPEMHHLQWPR
jgi:hypothetical protein